MEIDVDLQAYCLRHSTRLPEGSERIAIQTSLHPNSRWLIGPIVANLLRILIHARNCQSILEIGGFTGFSASAMAAALPDGGHIWSVEEDFDTFITLSQNIVNANMSNRITPIHGEGFAWLHESHQVFDLIFLDARKEAFPDGIELIASHLSDRGLLVVDNALCKGEVLTREKQFGIAADAFNRRLSSDRRFLVTILRERDGITVAIKVSA